MSTSVIIGMAVATVASAITEKILEACGKQNAAMYLQIATVSGLAVTALSIFAKFVKQLSTLG